MPLIADGQLRYAIVAQLKSHFEIVDKRRAAEEKEDEAYFAEMDAAAADGARAAADAAADDARAAAADARAAAADTAARAADLASLNKRMAKGAEDSTRLLENALKLRSDCLEHKEAVFKLSQRARDLGYFRAVEEQAVAAEDDQSD